MRSLYEYLTQAGWNTPRRTCKGKESETLCARCPGLRRARHRYYFVRLFCRAILPRGYASRDYFVRLGRFWDI